MRSCPARPGPPSTPSAQNGSVLSTTGSMRTSSGCTTTGPTAASPAARRQDVGLLGRSRHRAQPLRGACTSLVMGVGYDPDGDTSAGDRGGSSLAATLAADTARHVSYAYTWRQALAATAAGTLQPLHAIAATESDTGIADPVQQRRAGARLHADLRGRRRGRFPCLHQCRPGRHQPRPHARGGAAHGAAGRVRADDRARAALRGRQPRTCRPQPATPRPA